MGKKFFSGWETWEKLVFILACAIVVTVLLGCGKLIYTHRRLRKYAAVEEENKERAMNRQMSQRQKSRGFVESDKEPFGIRALERGIEIEGIWVSPGNSPLSSRDHSPASSWCERIPRTENHADIEKQDVHYTHDTLKSDSATAVNRSSRASFESANVTTNLSRSYCGRDINPSAQIAKPARSRHPPLSYNRYQGNPYSLRRQSSATTTLQGLEAIHKASTSMRDPQSAGSTESSFSSDRSSNGAADVEPISASAPDLLAGQGRSYAKHLSASSSDLELLNSHRVSQAAETGQLTPRGRKAGKAYRVDFATPSARVLAPMQRSYLDSVQARPVRSSNKTPHVKNPFVSPKIDALPPAVRRTSLPDVTPFTEFCKMAPPSPPLRSSRSNSMESVQTSTPKIDGENDSEFGPPSPIMPASEGAIELKLPPPKRGSFEKGAPQVVRGFGTGFEILRPGSLNPPVPKEWKAEKQWSAPPVSLHNTAGVQSSGVGSEQKLQKKRRQSTESVASSKISRRSRISLLF